MYKQAVGQGALKLVTGFTPSPCQRKAPWAVQACFCHLDSRMLLLHRQPAYCYHIDSLHADYHLDAQALGPQQMLYFTFVWVPDSQCIEASTMQLAVNMCVTPCLQSSYYK